MNLSMASLLLIFVAVALPGTAGEAASQPADSLYVLSADRLDAESRTFVLPVEWKYYPGDDPAFARPSFDAASWPVVDACLPEGETPESWDGLGWFRLRLRVDSTLLNRPLGLRLFQYGASEVYLDGKLIQRFGRPARTAAGEAVAVDPAPVAVVLRDSATHVLAIRYSNHATEALHEVGYPAGFTIRIGRLEPMVAAYAQTVRSATTIQVGLTSLYLAFGLLHLFLFAFYPAIRANFYFALVAICIAAVAFNNYQERFFYSNPAELIFIRRLWSPLSLLTVLAFLRFLYAVYYERPPRPFYVLLGSALLIGAWGWFDPTLGWYDPAGGRTYAYAFALLLHVEILRTTFTATFLQKHGSYLIGLGAVVFVVAFIYPPLVVTGLLEPFVNTLLFSFGVILGLLIAISLYLSRHVAQTNQALERKLDEVKTLSAQKLEQERHAAEEALEHQRLEAEYERKLEELEEARRLQLSMLPETMPEHPDLELAAYMETATEVGGDYYDFDLGEDGTLTLAVGDATGHGLKAGTMVTAMKSLFNALGQEPDLLGIFDRSTRALKRMNLRKLYMALTLAKFDDGTLRMATAGMPPALLYHARTGQVETVRLKGMPLGSFPDFPYREKTLTLHPGDAVLFMSDGFPERFSEDGEMLGYDQAEALFAEVADRAPQAVIDYFVEKGRAWANGRPPDDDITFVAVKRRAESS